MILPGRIMHFFFVKLRKRIGDVVDNVYKQQKTEAAKITFKQKVPFVLLPLHQRQAAPCHPSHGRHVFTLDAQ